MFAIQHIKKATRKKSLGFSFKLQVRVYWLFYFEFRVCRITASHSASIRAAFCLMLTVFNSQFYSRSLFSFEFRFHFEHTRNERMKKNRRNQRKKTSDKKWALLHKQNELSCVRAALPICRSQLCLFVIRTNLKSSNE